MAELLSGAALAGLTLAALLSAAGRGVAARDSDLARNHGRMKQTDSAKG